MAGSNYQRQKCSAQEGQRASTIGISQSTLVLAADHIAAPVHFVLNCPISADLFGHPLGSRFVGSEAEGEVARARFVLPGGFMSSLALQADQLSGVRIGRRIWLDAHRAQRAFVQEAAGAFAVGKRGEVGSSFWRAKAWSVGWLSRRAAM